MLKQYDIAPTDGLEENRGQWQKLDKNKVKINISANGQPAQNYVFEIVSIKGDVLKLKKIPTTSN